MSGEAFFKIESSHDVVAGEFDRVCPGIYTAAVCDVLL
jgi:hypothetical protein